LLGTRGLFAGALLALMLPGCTVPYTRSGYDHGGEDFSDGHIYVTDMLSHGCEYDNPITMVVPLEESAHDAARTRCILQTENHGPEIVNAP